MNIDVREPEGNVYCILSQFKRLSKELAKSGCDVSEYDKLLKNYRDMKYDQILDEIERITNGTIKFEGRPTK